MTLFRGLKEIGIYFSEYKSLGEKWPGNKHSQWYWKNTKRWRRPETRRRRIEKTIEMLKGKKK